MKDLALKEKRLKGLALSRGYAVGRVCLLNENRHSNLPMYRVVGAGLEREEFRVRRAIEISRDQLDKIREEVKTRIGSAEAEIFVAHRMILEDPQLSREIFERIQGENINAEAAVAYVLDSYEDRLMALDDEYLKTRATDFGDIKRRLLDVLGNMRPSLQCDKEHCLQGRNRIIVASELTPSLTVDIDPDLTIGFVTEHGGINSHAAILARAMGIPAVSGLSGIRDMIGCGMEILIDGTKGEVVLWPADESIADVTSKAPSARGVIEPVDPVDGFKVMANVNIASDLKHCLNMNAEGIGLYRTEFEVMAAERFFTEDELYQRYKPVVDSLAGRGVVFRMFDMGSDKSLPFMKIPREENPSLGWRGARLLLGRPDIMAPQARALARVSACEGGRIHVMYPMIVDLQQFVQLKDVFMEMISGIEHGQILHGIMFEVPSACLQASELFDVIDFASVGTNDLTQYLFAVDRDNDNVSYDYNPDKTVMWSVLKSLADAAAKAGKSLSICGELAGYSNFVPKLIEAGVTAVSVSPRRIPEVRLAAADFFKNKQNKEIV